MAKEVSNSFSKLRRSFRGWFVERKLRSIVSIPKRHFEKTFAEEVKETGETEADFDFVRKLGRGTYGVVNLFRSKKTSQFSAVKVLYKSQIKPTNVENEIKLMSSIMHPFIATMKGHFTVCDKLYIEMPYYSGGSLFSLLCKHGKCSYELCRFYGAQLVLAIDFLHSLGVVHRDLKPDNIMIDSDGYLKIIDFGMSKRSVTGRYRTICGTPVYMAPEIYLAMASGRCSYDESVDWWAFGVIMFNTITGKNPFQKNFGVADVVKGNINYPLDMDQGSKNFLQAILEVNVSKRLGCGKAGAREIMKHPWFRGVKWTRLFSKKVKVPMMPEINSESNLTDTAIDRNGKHSRVESFDFNGF